MTAEHSFLGELRDFLQFLKSLWGLLAGIAMLFPLANALIAVVPIDGDAGRSTNCRRPW